MRLDSVHFSMLVIGVSFACYSPSLNSLQDQAYKSTVVIEGKVHSVPANVSTEPYSVNVKVLDVWPLNSGGLEREQLVTVGEFGSEAPCTTVEKDHRYIFFMDPTDEPLVFKASYAPLDTNGKNLKKDVGRILCEDCAAPKIKQLKNQSVVEGNKLLLKCEASGKPPPEYKWYRDGSEFKKSKEIKIKTSKRNSRILINRARLEDSGNYTCVAENMHGRDNSTSTVNVQSSTTTLSPGSGHARRCNETERAYCVNGGDCYFIHGINQLSCKCPPEFFGPRCLQTEPLRLYMPKPYKKAEELYKKRVLTITGICVALLVVGIVCVVAYCKTKKQRKKMHSHLRQNMCAENPNRNLANGPNHPGPGPEEIPMVDYISKNVPATEHVIRHAGTSFTGSRASSRSHHSSTATHSSSHRNEDRTWSLDRTGSVMSDSRSGMMSSSVGTSKCNSPACVEARAWRAAHCGITEPHAPPASAASAAAAAAARYRDSFDSLGDSPHSDRYVSALTTPARLSPVDFHYSLPPQVPTFQITSPLPPAARMPYYLEDDQPLLRRFQLPLQDVARPQRRTYLNDSTGSLPASPYRLADDEEYETTQEYLSSLEQPKRAASGGGRRWRRSRLNGHVAPRGDSARNYSSQSCLSDSDSEEEEEEEQGESTPFLSMQNMNAEPAAGYRPPDSRTYHPSARHGSRGNTQARLSHSRSKPDNAPL
ncbi:pro-neuregulin-2, membrane-bound isoform-like isoform X3 [Anguilla anguilla]|uniref:pro-neuregulin-2, membrane-bound isoform-like isoform X3 n=1 Tax=Anguilla anguilla TaxID=7936 RepID=UPI0015AB6C47|nr:pro-neuregulin-2, membrane-bound isoform-like isoform X3 [Anguilla anguilla]